MEEDTSVSVLAWSKVEVADNECSSRGNMDRSRTEVVIAICGSR